jgi:hypothetical protein
MILTANGEGIAPSCVISISTLVQPIDGVVRIESSPREKATPIILEMMRSVYPHDEVFGHLGRQPTATGEGSHKYGASLAYQADRNPFPFRSPTRLAIALGCRWRDCQGFERARCLPRG